MVRPVRESIPFVFSISLFYLSSAPFHYSPQLGNTHLIISESYLPSNNAISAVKSAISCSLSNN
ncbi:hypothetical protein BDZ91DRAFT_752177 [Kalaharituber pfeilii]|nr:hypothetical protein BDZ91DRAFT_752177 [Kalaharituber pfeilii]